MVDSWYDYFIEEIEKERDGLIQNICDDKAYTWQLVSEYLEDESEFQSFVDQYNMFFQAEHLRLKNLKHEEKTLIQGLESYHEEDTLREFDNFFFEKEPNTDEETSTFEPTFENEQDFIFIPDFTPGTTSLPDIPSYNGETKSQRPRLDIKTRVSHMFRWIYHPRREEQSEDPFFKERSTLINQLMGEPTYNAIDIILRIPFTERDRELWTQPLPKEGRSGQLESIGEQLFRYRLWNRMLQVAIPIAESIASSPPHELYDSYLDMKARDLQAIAYFDELATQKKQEIHDLQQRIIQLRAELASKGGDPT